MVENHYHEEFLVQNLSIKHFYTLHILINLPPNEEVNYYLNKKSVNMKGFHQLYKNYYGQY